MRAAPRAPRPPPSATSRPKCATPSARSRRPWPFGGYVAEEGVFFGGKGPLRGRAAVVQAWTRFFEGKEAPFSWEPETVEVLPSGNLALTAGPVRDPKGTLIGTFSTVWRLETDGRWRVIFDRGCDVCAPETKH